MASPTISSDFHTWTVRFGDGSERRVRLVHWKTARDAAIKAVEDHGDHEDDVTIVEVVRDGVWRTFRVEVVRSYAAMEVCDDQ